jgi:diaminopimelate decarboxylase
MAVLPIPGKIYINDFPDKALYVIKRNSVVIGEFQGLINTDENGNHVAFLYGTTVQSGDIITADYFTPVTVVSTDIDTYNGKPEIIKAYY